MSGTGLPPGWREISHTLPKNTTHTLGELGWRSGESARLPPMCPGFDSRTRRHMWVEFVVGSRPSSEGFSPGSPVFLPPQKSTFLNSNSIGNSRATGLSVEDCYVLPSLNKVNLFYLFIYLRISFCYWSITFISLPISLLSITRNCHYLSLH